MGKVLSWRIYFEGGEIFDSSMGRAWEAPNLGVICVVFKDSVEGASGVGRMLLQDYDWYYYMDYKDVPPRWQGSDVAGMHRALVSDIRHEVRGVREGRVVPFEEYRATIDKAIHDRDFPTMSARRKVA